MESNDEEARKLGTTVVKLAKKLFKENSVTYDTTDHCSVIFQMEGSVWPHVILYCILNAFITGSLWYVANVLDYEVITIDPLGHKFMAPLVAFLVVTRVKIVYSRFMEARQHLGTLFGSCRRLVDHAHVLTMHDTNDDAKEYRFEIAYRTITLLKITMATLEFESTHKDPWSMEEIANEDTPHFCASPRNSVVTQEVETEHITNSMRSRAIFDDTFRAPVVLAYSLRRAIMKQRSNKDLNHRLFHRHACNEELKLLQFVHEYVQGQFLDKLLLQLHHLSHALCHFIAFSHFPSIFMVYYVHYDHAALKTEGFDQLQKIITTPYPFPLVQMGRTFMFVWIFSLPFALIESSYNLEGIVTLIFILTYGFVGLEYVSMELDDPFGDDPNDFDNVGMAHQVFEDIYIATYRIDGPLAAARLRESVDQRVKRFDN